MRNEIGKPKRGQLYWMIIEVIILGILSGGGNPMRPTLPLIIDTIIKLLREAKKIDVEDKKIRRTLQSLEKREIIDLVEKDNKVFVFLNDNNNPQIVKYSLKSILDLKRKEKKWDGKWFLVFFDVPEIQRNKRDYLRRFLTKIGFYRYQKSVYVFPYECEKEINLIKQIVKGAKYMRYIIADKIEDEEQIKTFFHL